MAEQPAPEEPGMFAAADSEYLMMIPAEDTAAPWMGAPAVDIPGQPYHPPPGSVGPKVLADVVPLAFTGTATRAAPKHGGRQQQTPNPSMYQPSPHHGRRRKALLVGCSYPGQKAALRGCLNDIQCMGYLLKKNFGFVDSNMVMLRDDVNNPAFISNYRNIFQAIDWLVSGAQPGDSLFFHYSGHGGQKRDLDGDEADGFDETILPTDFQTSGQILDDQLNTAMVRRIPTGVVLHAVFDSCHSGTVLDLNFNTVKERGGRYQWTGRHVPHKSPPGGTVIQIGACKDSQTAADTSQLSGTAYTGAATFTVIQAIERFGIDMTYSVLLDHMIQVLKEMTQKSSRSQVRLGLLTTGLMTVALGPFGLLMGGMMVGPQMIAALAGQQPMIACDQQLDLYSTKLMI